MHFVELIQVFKHFGRTEGAGTDGARAGKLDADFRLGTLASEVSMIVVEVAGGAMHLVQIVEVMVLKIVEIVFEVWISLLLPDVTVLVTGQVVTVVWIL